ncbi:MAG: glycosyltransferase family 4 protein, partial [Saprospiraceae bacterium]
SILIKNKYDLLHLFNNKAIVNGIRAAKGLSVKVATYRGVVGNANWYDPTSYLTHLHPRVDGITALSPAVNVYLNRQVWKNSKIIETVPKGQHSDWFKNVQIADLQQFKVLKDIFTIACIANVRKVKGIPDLITAMRHLSSDHEWNVLLIGNGMDSPKIKQLIDRSPRWVHFYPIGFQKDVLPYIAAADLYVQPSRMEGLGKTVQEAMMLEKPVVATAVGGLKDLVINEKTGLAVPAQSPRQLAEAIERMRSDNALRQRLAKAGRQHIEKEFSVTKSAELLVAFYRKLV